MSVNNVNFLNLTMNKVISTDGIDKSEVQIVNVSGQDQETTYGLTFNNAPNDWFSEVSDQQVLEYMRVVSANPAEDTDADTGIPGSESPVIEPSPEIGSTPSLASIKSKIYNYRHPNMGISAYGSNFNAICSFLGVSATTSITKSQLTQLTKNDSQEDSNNDLCGALNRAFAGKKPDEVITYKELQLFFMRASGFDNSMTMSEYKTVVNKYSEKLQNQFEAMGNSAKLNFIIEKTEEYLESAGLDKQMAALTRLKTQDGTVNTNPNGNQVCSVGQIAFADLGSWEDIPGSVIGYDASGNPINGKSITNGAYTAARWTFTDVAPDGSDGGDYKAAAFCDDNDGSSDCGITLNINFLSGYKLVAKNYGTYMELKHESYKWYEIVETLVHELTHATAYQYADLSETSYFKPSLQGLNYMASKGIISSSEANHFYYDFDDLTMQEYQRLIYLVNTMTGEYSAFIQTANYLDSVGGDVFDSGNSLAVNGANEESAIKNHVDSMYNSTRPAGQKEAIMTNFGLYA